MKKTQVLNLKASEVRLNRFGFREREFDATKPAGTMRMAFIGNSYTFGQGIPETERMSNLLEARLRPTVEAVEVLNYGNTGNNTVDEVLVLREALKQADPDFVLLQWFVNDVEYKGHKGDGTMPDGPEPSAINRFKMVMRNTSVLYFLAAELWHRMLESMASNYEELTFARVGDPQSPDWLAAEEALLDFIQACEKHDVPVGIVLVPYVTPLQGRPYPYAYLHERILGICEREGIPCTDLLNTFQP